MQFVLLGNVFAAWTLNTGNVFCSDFEPRAGCQRSSRWIVVVQGAGL